MQSRRQALLRYNLEVHHLSSDHIFSDSDLVGPSHLRALELC